MSWGAKPCYSASERPGEASLPFGILHYHIIILPSKIYNAILFSRILANTFARRRETSRSKLPVLVDCCIWTDQDPSLKESALKQMQEPVLIVKAIWSNGKMMLKTD